MANEKPHQKLIKEGEKALKDPDVKPEEIEKWWKNKGMDRSEAKEAMDKWKHSKGAEAWNKLQKSTPKSSSASQQSQINSPRKWGFWFIIFLLVLAGTGAYLYYIGLIRF